MDEHTDENSDKIIDEFQPILDAASEYEASKWVLGNAVLEICGPPGKPGVNNGSLERIKQAAEYLQNNGIDFTAKYLTEMRDISHLFPAAKRLGAAGISWSVFREFRSCPQILLGRVKKNPDLTMTVAEAKKIVGDYKARQQQREEKAAAEASGGVEPETVDTTSTDPVVEAPVEPTVSEPVEGVVTEPVEPIVVPPVETDEEDIQTAPEPEETKSDKYSAKSFAAKIIEADDMNALAIKLTNFVKSAHPDDPDWVNEMIHSVSKTQEELKKLKSLLRALSNKSKPAANGGDNVTQFPIAAAPGE